MNFTRFGTINIPTSFDFSQITNTPTTLSGYGITDAVPSSRTLTINGTTFDLTANRTWTIAGGGGVTSVDMSVPTGLSISGNPITTSGILSLTFSAGYSIPLNTKQSNWDDAYTFVTAFPSQTGNNGKYLTTNGSTLSWATVSGGGLSPGGNSGTVQYNYDGAFDGAANVEIDTGNLKLISTTDPITPTGGILSYSKVVGGRHLPKIIEPSGVDTIMQVGLHGNSVMMIAPSNGTTAPTIWGGVLATAVTISHQQTIASANPWQATRRTRFQTSTTAGNTSGMRTGNVQWFRGSANGFGGFWFRCQLGMNINLNGGQKFVGLCNSTAVLGGDPSALLNMCGMGYDAGDASTDSWFFMYNDGTGTATKVNLGANALRNTNDGYDLVMYMAPNGSELFVRIINLQTNVTVLETSYTTLLPVANTGMAFKAEVRNGAVAAVDNLEIAKVYIETDF